MTEAVDRKGIGVPWDAIKRSHASQPRNVEAFNHAIDYLEGRMVEHVRDELRDLFSESNKGDTDQRMQPIAIPLTERYVSESATLYNREVQREVTDIASGKPDKDLTKRWKEYLDGIGFNRSLHGADQLTALLRSCGVWLQEKRGDLDVVITAPQLVTLVKPEARENFNPVSLDDYQGALIELGASNDTKQWAYISRAITAYYDGDKPEEGRNVSVHANPWQWGVMRPGRAKPETQSLMPFALLQHPMPLQHAIPAHDADVARLNHEINVMLSSVIDTFRFQSYATPVIYLAVTNAGEHERPHGVRFPIRLQVGESASYITSGVSYVELLGFLQSLTKLVGVMKRQSPNEFAIEGAGPQSGFAKLVDSLPKIEARRERAEAMKAAEEQRLFPIVASILTRIGVFKESELAGKKLVVTYTDIEMPMSVDERTRQEEHDIKHGLTTPAEILAKRRGITTEDAEKLIAENRARQQRSGGPSTEAQQPGVQSGEQSQGGPQSAGGVAPLRSQRAGLGARLDAALRTGRG